MSNLGYCVYIIIYTHNMPHQAKESIISLIGSTIVTLPYLIYVFGRFQSEALSTEAEFKFWATAILLMIPLRIIAEIVMHILAAIFEAIITQAEPEFDDTVDERDRQIGLKAQRNSYVTFALGVFIALVLVAINGSPTTMFIVFILAGFASDLADHISKLVYYQRG